MRGFCAAKRVNAGLPRDFVIYDDDDQLAAVKLVMATLAIDDDAFDPAQRVEPHQPCEEPWQTPRK